MTRHRPNILLLFTDQQRFDTTHALGNPDIQTQNFDRLLAMGTAFTSAYTCSLIDIASTCTETAGTGFGDHKADGMSLMDPAAGKGDTVFSQQESGDLATYMAVNKRWKLWYGAPDNQEWFFDRVQDPEETRSRAGVVFPEDYQEQMRRLLMQHLASGGVFWPEGIRP